MCTKVGILAFALVVLGTAGAAETVGPSPAKACAAYDLHLVTLVEDHGLADEVPGSVIADAMMRVIEARTVCGRGDHATGLDLYSRIALGRPSLPIEFAATR